jgi:hypothetical protein
MESEEVRRAFENFVSVVTETQEALAGSARDAAARGGEAAAPDADTPVTLIEFMKEHCQGGHEMSPNILDSRRNSIQNAALAGTVALPEHVGAWKTGKSKYYRPGELANLWDEYRAVLPNLPALKPKGPSSGGQTS